MKPDTNKEMKLFNGDSYKNYQQNSASIHCHSMEQKKKKKKKKKKRENNNGLQCSPEVNRFTYLISKFHKTTVQDFSINFILKRHMTVLNKQPPGL